MTIDEADMLRKENARFRAALEKAYAYFMAAARAWAADEGRVVNEDGFIIAEAQGLDELADDAAIAIQEALGITEGTLRAEADAMMRPRV